MSSVDTVAGTRQRTQQSTDRRRQQQQRLITQRWLVQLTSLPTIGNEKIKGKTYNPVFLYLDIQRHQTPGNSNEHKTVQIAKYIYK
ncbi:hypothetical protein C0Q70_11215 [Pomacea canaliculata]|uniref:Uncharacterized protein n=1 Tax=Pomacea canaliculata TaxID=400727 RepID=A0A2T7P5B7_POMCA|nr:hypothetical protein C0Q70_11215 [Pomacea canaliculata]